MDPKMGPIKAEQRLVRVDRKPPKPGHGNRFATVDYWYECPTCKKEFKSKAKYSVFCGRKCSAQFHASRPRYRNCANCGKQFVIRIGRGGQYSKRATCSAKCEKEQRAKNIDYECPERRMKLSNSSISNNSAKNLNTASVIKKRSKGIAKAKRHIHNKGASALGVPRTMRVSVIQSPSGEIFTTDCVRQFVRDNEDLFDKSDVERRRSNASRRYTDIEGNLTCRAMAGLQSIVCGSRKTWKGWLLIENRLSTKMH